MKEYKGLNTQQVEAKLLIVDDIVKLKIEDIVRADLETRSNQFI